MVGGVLGFLLKKIVRPHIWQRIFIERLSEPLHLNILSLFVAAFGSTRAKIAFDLCVRQYHAFGLLCAAENALTLGYKRVTVIEFGVANGAGLLNMCSLAEKISKETGVSFHIVGFDGADGMPPCRDYRDHPEAYQPGWYPMQSPELLRSTLPANATLIIGNIVDTIPPFLAALPQDAPIGFVSLDVDYYWSSVDALTALSGPPERYLPLVTMYLDDIGFQTHNPWCGELGAIADFNAAHGMRKISPFNFLRETRLFKNAQWISHMYTFHAFDHPARFTVLKNHEQIVLENPYLKIGRNEPERSCTFEAQKSKVQQL